MRYALILLLSLPAAAQDRSTPKTPGAATTYDRMLAALRAAQTLSYESEYWREVDGSAVCRCRMRFELAKPNHFRVESTDMAGNRGGTIVGDGELLWIHWPGGRPRFTTEERADWERTRSDVYMVEAAPKGRHSIAHRLSLLGPGLGMTVLNPSKFFGGRDSMDRYRGTVREKEREDVAGEPCDVVEVSFMDGQRTRTFWVSRRDHLPRKLKGVVRGGITTITWERWHGIEVGAAIGRERFVWTPPEGWRRWRLPRQEGRLLKKGVRAPDFDLALLGGGRARLKDYRGKLVWLVFWRSG